MWKRALWNHRIDSLSEDRAWAETKRIILDTSTNVHIDGGACAHACGQSVAGSGIALNMDVEETDVHVIVFYSVAISVMNSTTAILRNIGQLQALQMSRWQGGPLRCRETRCGHGGQTYLIFCGRNFYMFLCLPSQKFPSRRSERWP